MSNFFSGLRSALTRATSYGSATSAQSLHEAPEISEGEGVTEDVGLRGTPESTKNDISTGEDNSITLRAVQLEKSDQSDDSQAVSSRTLSVDEEPAALDNTTLLNSGPETPQQGGNVNTPRTIFETAQKDIFRSAFKSAAKERDIFMTAKPTRTWEPQIAEEYVPSPSVAGSVDDSSVTLSLDQASHTLENTPSVSSKRDREEDEDSYVHAIQDASPKRRQTSLSPELERQDTSLARRWNEGNFNDSSHHLSELDTSGLSDDDTSGFSSSDSWSFDSPPPGLDRKGRRNWKRQQRRTTSKSMEGIYGTKKPKVGKRSSRSGFRRSVSGRDLLIRHARKRFWEGRLARDVYCY